MSYYIKVVIKGRNERLNKVGPPTYLLSEKHDFVRKNMLASYIYSNFKDIMNSRADLEKAEYMKDKTIILSYDYTKQDPLYDMIKI